MIVYWAALVGAPWLGALFAVLLPSKWRGWARGVALAAMVLSVLGLVALLRAAGPTASWGPEGAESALGTGAAGSSIQASGLAMRLDPLALPFLVTVLGVSLVAVGYGWGYFEGVYDEHLCYALMLVFAGSMAGTLLADNALLFFVLWEGMLLSSSLLLAGWGEGEAAAGVTLKYFVYTQLGSLLILVALNWMVAAAGSAHLGTMAARLPALAGQQRMWMVGLLVAGFALKMAVFPMHGWLPDAHTVAPMPVTVMLAAAMLGMGAYGMLRFGGLLLHDDLMVAWRAPLMVLALASQVYGALMCLAARDIKRLIAYSSVSQMGYVLFALGSFSARGVAGGVLHVVNHGVLKALLFMGVGLIIRSTGRREVAQLGGLVRSMPGVVLGLSAGALAMTGLPPFCAFHSEWMIIEGGLASGLPLLAYLELVAPLATTAYAAWLVARLTLGQSDSGLTVISTPATMRYAFYGLLVLALLMGLSPGMLYRWADGAAIAFGLGG